MKTMNGQSFYEKQEILYFLSEDKEQVNAIQQDIGELTKKMSENEAMRNYLCRALG